MKKLLQNLAQAIAQGKAKQAKILVEEAVEMHIPAEQIMEEGMMEAMRRITALMEAESAFVPEVIMASRAMNVATVILEEALGEAPAPKIGTVVAATVRGDLHDLGVNLVSMMLRNTGFEVYNMGCDIAAEQIIAKAQEVNADIICLSAMLTTTMPQIQRVIRLLENKGLREEYLIMVGGAPVTERYAKRMGADIYTADAGQAALQAKQWMEKEK